MTQRTDRVIFDLLQERARQEKLYPEQMHPDGTGGQLAAKLALWARDQVFEAEDEGKVTWKLLLQQETYEAFAETAPDRLRAELVQVIAVATAWVECIDSRAELADDAMAVALE